MFSTEDQMRPPYKLRFSEKPKAVSQVAIVPDWCQDEMSIARDRILYELTSADVLSQRLRQRYFFVDMMAVRSRARFGFKIKIEKEFIFFIFMLEGHIEFETARGAYITDVKQNKFFLCRNRKGCYQAKVEPGLHRILVVSIDKKWARSSFKEFFKLNFEAQRKFYKTLPFRIMPQCRMDRDIRRLFREVNSLKESSVTVLESMLTVYISRTLDKYNKLLQLKEDALAYRIRAYLDEHYDDNDLTYRKIAETVFSTVRTVGSCFKNEFHITAHDYYTRLRMKKAESLMNEHNLADKDVYLEVGYSDLKSFRMAYEKMKAEGLI